MTAWDALHEITNEATDQDVFKAGAQFLLKWEPLKSKIKFLSEGQKGLLCYARFFLQKPHVLILDEPTNHINFRHLPIIAQALNAYKGAMIMVSHDEWFLREMKWLEEIDLGRLVK
jgi:ATP-binding cassette subfamily F protein 3